MSVRTINIGSGPLLNFYKREITLAHPITGEWVEWPSVEHYFQACKGLYLKAPPQKTPWQAYKAIEDIRLTSSPHDAKAKGRALPVSLSLWNRACFAHMLQGHIAKFSQHADFRTMLLQTGSAKLVEHRPDALWGDNMDGTGKNLCGRSLMIVRRISRDWSPA